MKRVIFAFLLSSVAAFVVKPALSHHSFLAEFDPDRRVTLTGEVTELAWANPHAYVYLDVRDDDTGEVANWAVELGSPNSLTRLGWRRTTVEVGDVLVIEGTLGRHREHLANARSAILQRTGARLGAASSEGSR